VRELKSIAICICTYKRPEGLRQLLAALGEQRFVKNKPPSIKVVVVDNDPRKSAQPVIEDVENAESQSIEYRTEERRGIPFARNKALSGVNDNDAVAFLDDDEWPCDTWLDELMATAREYKADVVSGPVNYRFTEGAPRWFVRNEYFRKDRYRTGTVLPHASTNNALMKTEILANMQYLFDERFGLQGGSDIEFFSRVNSIGYRIVWSEEAVVWEDVPRERARLWWILQRNYRLGNEKSLTEIDEDTSIARKGIRFAKGSLRIVYGASVLVPFGIIGIFSHDVGVVDALCNIARGFGSITGSFGIPLEYYRECN
jgi:succinoglycan biosynthesis protein ExoM